MPNLLDTLGQEAEKKAARQKVESPTAQNDMLDGETVKIDTNTTKVTPPTNEESKKEVKAEPTSGKSKNDNLFEEWTDKDYQKALKEARKDAAKYRTRSKDQEEQQEVQIRQIMKEIDEKYAPLKTKAAELDKLKNQEADKKRDMAEKLTHREQEILKREEELQALKESSHDKLVELQNRLGKVQVELDAHESFYKEQLEKELSEIPAEWEQVADAMVKGAEGTREALDLVRDAKRKNFFGKKKVEVFNNSPTKASDGARLSSSQAREDQRNKMKSSDKIKVGLKGMISGIEEHKGKFGI